MELSETQTKQPVENKMGVMKEGKLLANMALPLIASMLVQALYNIVDSVYVSHIDDGGCALTALSLSFPIQNMMIGFASGVAVGVNSLFSRSLGEKNQEKVNRSAGNGIVLSAISALLFLLFGIFGVGPYYTVQSTNALTVSSGISYSSICCIFAAGIFGEVLFERMLQASGRTVHTMITQGIGAIINIILDPMLIFGIGFFPELGVAGAAIATVIGQWVAAILAFVFNLKYNKDVQLTLKSMRLRWETVKQILSVGIPTTIMMAISSVMNFGMNQIFQGLDPDEIATSVFGVYYKLQSFFFMPIFGLNNATISILAYNYGYRKPKRILRTLRLSCTVALVIMFLGTATFHLIPDLLLSIFKADPRFLEMGVPALRIVSIHFPVAAICIILGSTFQALGTGIYSTITSLFRQLIALLPAAYLLSLTGLVNNVWWAFLIAEFVSLVFSLFFFIRIYRKKIRPLSQKATGEEKQPAQA